MNEIPGRLYAKFHRPRFYRYKVADPGARVTRNLYRNGSSSAFIGVAVVAGRYAYCVKWADAKLDLDAEGRT
jgi:hypothetical protein